LFRNTVYSWTVGERDPSKKYLGRVISVPSPQLSYVIMAAKGDGCSGMRRNGVKGYLYVTDFRVRDKDFAEEFAASASYALHRSSPYKVNVSDSGFYLVSVKSKMLYEIMEKTSITSLKQYIESSRDSIVSAVRGLFDAEGGPGVSINYRGEFNATISAANSNVNILRYTKRLSNKLGIFSRLRVNAYPAHWSSINGRSIFFAKPTHALIIARIADVEKFIRVVGSGISRKQQKMNDILLVLQSETRERANTWLASYHKNGKGEYERKIPEDTKSRATSEMREASK
jgi:intein-encoded DNA endonuclease-like protein